MPSGTASLECVVRILSDVTHRKMMGEYLLYRDGKLFGGIYDDRLLLKITKATAGIAEWPQAIPYDGGPEMVLVP
jgi:TfoX/Sxy family transcriptional regulator of competence genes